VVIPVRSAFGGLGIYRADVLRQHPTCVYSSRTDGRTDFMECEHVPLNLCLHEKGAKQFISTGLLVQWEGCGR
jgi:hypothetical protein